MTLMSLAVMPLVVCGAMLPIGAILGAAKASYHAALGTRNRRGGRPAAR